MSDIGREIEAVNWTKCTFGLKIVKVAFSDYIKEKWIQFLLNWSTEELDGLQCFFNNVEKNIIQYESKNKAWIINTTCVTCKRILDKLQNIQRPKNSRKIVWNPNNTSSNKTKFSGNKIITTSSFETRCRICYRKECIFEAERAGFDLEGPETSARLLFSTLFSKGQEIAEKYYWRIANMFIFRGTERSSMPNTSPLDTDASLVFKMMRNCSLFKEDDETYDDILDVRNFLMHSPNQRVTNEDSQKCIDTFKSMLTEFEVECKHSHLGIQEIKRLDSALMISTLVNGHDNVLMEEALKIQQQAVKFDIQVTGRISQTKVILDEILDAIQTKCINKNWTYDLAEKRKQDEDYLKRENNILINENKRLKEEIERLATPKQQTDDGLLGDVVKAGAIGASFGTFGGPVGVLIGGGAAAIGTAISGGLERIFR